MMANEIRKATSQNRFVCLIKAWQLHRLIDQLQTGIVSFAYERADGILRRATGTLKNVEYWMKRTGKKSYKTLCYYDVKASAFRSFRIENLITIY